MFQSILFRIHLFIFGRYKHSFMYFVRILESERYVRDSAENEEWARRNVKRKDLLSVLLCFERFSRFFFSLYCCCCDFQYIFRLVRLFLSIFIDFPSFGRLITLDSDASLRQFSMRTMHFNSNIPTASLSLCSNVSNLHLSSDMPNWFVATDNKRTHAHTRTTASKGKPKAIINKIHSW